MSTRWTLSAALILLLVATVSVAAVGEDFRIIPVDQDGKALILPDGPGDEIVIQYGDPDDLITGNRGAGVIGENLSNGSLSTLLPEYDSANFFVTLARMICYIP